MGARLLRNCGWRRSAGSTHVLFAPHPAPWSDGGGIFPQALRGGGAERVEAGPPSWATWRELSRPASRRSRPRRSAVSASHRDQPLNVSPLRERVAGCLLPCSATADEVLGGTRSRFPRHGPGDPAAWATWLDRARSRRTPPCSASAGHQLLCRRWALRPSAPFDTGAPTTRSRPVTRRIASPPEQRLRCPGARRRPRSTATHPGRRLRAADLSHLHLYDRTVSAWC